MLTECYRFLSKEINVQWMFSFVQALEIGEGKKGDFFLKEGERMRGEIVHI